MSISGTDTKDPLLTTHEVRVGTSDKQLVERTILTYGRALTCLKKGRYVSIAIEAYNNPGESFDITNSIKSLNEMIFENEQHDKFVAARALDTLNNISIGDYFGTMDDSSKGGCHVIFGGASSGKTTFVEKEFKGISGVSFYSVSEPSWDSKSLGSGLRAILLDLLTGSNNTIVVDSLRGIVYSGAGSTLSGGVSSELINVLSDFSRVADALGKKLYVIVNPLTPDESKVDVLLEAIRGSATGVTIFSNSDYDTARISDRRLSSRDWIDVPRNEIIPLLGGRMSVAVSNTHHSLVTNEIVAPDEPVVQQETIASALVAEARGRNLASVYNPKGK